MVYNDIVCVGQMMDAEKEKMRSELEHHRKSQAYQELEQKVHRLEKSNRRSIATAKPYYDLKSNLELQLKVSIAYLAHLLVVLCFLVLCFDCGSYAICTHIAPTPMSGC